MSKTLEAAVILSNKNLIGDYFHIQFNSPEIAKLAQPGQFLHLQVPHFDHRVLRRPFSIYNVEPATGVVELVYKTVGEGTQRLSEIPAGTEISLMGPLGTPFSVPTDTHPIIVAGGYGCAATYMLAKHSPLKGVTLIGGRSEIDLLLVEEFKATGYEVRCSTNDGSVGHKGLVTEILIEELEKAKASGKPVSIHSCGPNPMLKAVAKVAEDFGLDAEISLDEHMCCGIGACFTCVCKTKADNEDGWEYSRSCKDGPVYQASTIHWD